MFVEEKLINKSLQRGEDVYLDNILHTLFGISEVCLPSVLKALIAWYERKEKEIMEKINPALVFTIDLVEKFRELPENFSKRLKYEKRTSLCSFCVSVKKSVRDRKWA